MSDPNLPLDPVIRIFRDRISVPNPSIARKTMPLLYSHHTCV